MNNIDLYKKLKSIIKDIDNSYYHIDKNSLIGSRVREMIKDIEDRAMELKVKELLK